MFKDKHATAIIILRLGIGFAFLYASISSFLNPYDWIGYFPKQIRGIIPDDLLLHIHSAGELILGLWLLSGFKTFYSAILAALATTGIILANIGAMDIVFRDVAILFSCIALAIESRIKTD